MPEISLREAIGFRVWAKMMIQNHESFRVAEPDAQIDFFGQDESTYLVLNLYTGENTAIEYVFLPENEDDEGKSAMLIFDFLGTVNYSLDELLNWLAAAEYKDTEMGDKVIVCGLAISRRFASGN